MSTKRPRSKDDSLPYDLADCPGPTPTGFLGAARPEGSALAALALSEAEVRQFDDDGFVATAQPVLSLSLIHI